MPARRAARSAFRSALAVAIAAAACSALQQHVAEKLAVGVRERAAHNRACSARFPLLKRVYSDLENSPRCWSERAVTPEECAMPEPMAELHRAAARHNVSRYWSTLLPMYVAGYADAMSMDARQIDGIVRSRKRAPAVIQATLDAVARLTAFVAAYKPMAGSLGNYELRHAAVLFHARHAVVDPLLLARSPPVDDGDLAAWRDLHASLAGPSWQRCADLAARPCECAFVFCSPRRVGGRASRRRGAPADDDVTLAEAERRDDDEADEEAAAWRRDLSEGRGDDPTRWRLRPTLLTLAEEPNLRGRLPASLPRMTALRGLVLSNVGGVVSNACERRTATSILGRMRLRYLSVAWHLPGLAAHRAAGLPPLPLARWLRALVVEMDGVSATSDAGTEWAFSQAALQGRHDAAVELAVRTTTGGPGWPAAAGGEEDEDDEYGEGEDGDGGWEEDEEDEDEDGEGGSGSGGRAESGSELEEAPRHLEHEGTPRPGRGPPGSDDEEGDEEDALAGVTALGLESQIGAGRLDATAEALGLRDRAELYRCMGVETGAGAEVGADGAAGGAGSNEVSLDAAAELFDSVLVVARAAVSLAGRGGVASVPAAGWSVFGALVNATHRPSSSAGEPWFWGAWRWRTGSQFVAPSRLVVRATVRLSAARGQSPGQARAAAAAALRGIGIGRLHVDIAQSAEHVCAPQAMAPTDVGGAAADAARLAGSAPASPTSASLASLHTAESLARDQLASYQRRVPGGQPPRSLRWVCSLPNLRRIGASGALTGLPSCLGRSLTRLVEMDVRGSRFGVDPLVSHPLPPSLALLNNTMRSFIGFQQGARACPPAGALYRRSGDAVPLTADLARARGDAVPGWAGPPLEAGEWSVVGGEAGSDGSPSHGLAAGVRVSSSQVGLDPSRLRCRPLFEALSDFKGEPAWQCAALPAGSTPDPATAVSEGWKFRFDVTEGPGAQPWWAWRRLEKFWIDGNFAYGRIPPSIGRLWPAMRTLDLYSNSLEGPVPAGIGAMKNLHQLQLQHNALTGPLPPRLFHPDTLPVLSVLHLQLNHALTGCVHAEAYAAGREPMLTAHTVGSKVDIDDCEGEA